MVHDVDMPEKTRGRFERFVWPLYDSVNQKYLALGEYLTVKFIKCMWKQIYRDHVSFY